VAPLTTRQIHDHLAGITYRPGWSWTLCEDPWEGPYIRFVWEGVPDSSGGGTIDIGFDTWLPPMLSTEQLDHFMQWRLARCEINESREFLQRGGRPLFDPHAVAV
jgi:hypothetical protein